MPDLQNIKEVNMGGMPPFIGFFMIQGSLSQRGAEMALCWCQKGL